MFLLIIFLKSFIFFVNLIFQANWFARNIRFTLFLLFLIGIKGLTLLLIIIIASHMVLVRCTWVIWNHICWREIVVRHLTTGERTISVNGDHGWHSYRSNTQITGSVNDRINTTFFSKSRYYYIRTRPL